MLLFFLLLLLLLLLMMMMMLLLLLLLPLAITIVNLSVHSNFYQLLIRRLFPRDTSYSRGYGDSPSEMCAFFRLEADKRVRILRVEA